MSALRVRTLAAVATVALAGTAVAEAHNKAKSTSPSAGSTVPRAISAVSVTFAAKPIGASIRVVGPGGRTVSRGKGAIEGKRLRVALKGKRRAGRYVARWRMVAGDGHVQRGSFSFRVR